MDDVEKYGMGIRWRGPHHGSKKQCSPTTAPCTDTQAPVAPTVTVSEVDNDGKPTASGVAEPGSTVTVTWPDGTTSTVTADPTTGAYEVESPTVQTNGNITATATDVNGNKSTPTTAPRRVHMLRQPFFTTQWLSIYLRILLFLFNA